MVLWALKQTMHAKFLMPGVGVIFSEFNSYNFHYFYYNSYINKIQQRFSTVLNTHKLMNKLIIKTEQWKIISIPHPTFTSILKGNKFIVIKMHNLSKITCLEWAINEARMTLEKH